MNRLIIKTVVVLLTAATIFSGCKKEEPIPPSTEEVLKFHIHTNVGNAGAEYGINYATADGRTFNLSDLRYYISNIVLIKSDGSEYPVEDKVLLVNPSQNEYELGEVPVGTYKGFKFFIGLDSTANHADPTTYAAGDPLAIQTPAIHWSWNSGYIFMKIEGQVDTSVAGNGNVDFPFFYHIGLDQFKKTVDFTTEAFTVSSGAEKEIGLEFDLLKVLNGVDMRTENVSHTMDNMPLASKISSNWPTCIVIE